MNRKQISKKKIILKLLPGEAAFVADYETMQHISETYKYMALECGSKEEAEAWSDVANRINEWIKETYYSGDTEDFDEEW